MTVKSEAEPVLRAERTRRSSPAAFLTIATATGPEVFALIELATSSSVDAALHRGREAASWIVWPPMPAPPVSAAATRAGSDEAAVCVCFQVSSDPSALAASLSAESLEAIAFRLFCRPVTLD